MCLLDSISRREVVVLTRVDDDAGEAIDHTTGVLVDDRALHIDITEEDTVERIVEHDVQSLKSSHDSDLWHTETRAIVTETHVLATLLAYLVKRFAHDAEVLLCRIGTTEALGRSTVGNVVDQALSRSTDHRDNVSTLSCSSLCLDHVLVDITRSNDHIEVRLRALTDRLKVVLAALSMLDDALHTLEDVWL